MQSIKRKIKMCVIWLTFGLILCITGCIKTNNVEENKEDILMDAQKDLETLGITLTELVDSAEGELTDDGYGYYRFHVCEGSTEALKSVLNNSCGEPMEISMDEIPGYLDHPIAKKLREDELIDAWCKFTSGHGGAKTRSIELYLTENDGENYLYSFG